MFNTSRRIIPIKNDKLEKIEMVKNWILGKKYDEAIKIYDKLRVIKNNDKFVIVTMDYMKDRCNIVLKNDIIIDVIDFY
jgi:hypothetical protein